MKNKQRHKCGFDKYGRCVSCNAKKERVMIKVDERKFNRALINLSLGLCGISPALKLISRRMKK